MFEKKPCLEEHADGLRRRMLPEPQRCRASSCKLTVLVCAPTADTGLMLMEHPEINSTGWSTGFANFLLYPSDPFHDGLFAGNQWSVHRQQSGQSMHGNIS